MRKCLHCNNIFKGSDYSSYMCYGKCPFCSSVGCFITPPPPAPPPTMYMLVANAGDISIPCRFSYDKDKLKKVLTDAFPEGGWNNDGKEESFNIRYGWEATEEDEKNNTGWFSIFTNYYDGCGGIYNFTLEEVEVDKVLFGFSLD